MRNIARRATVQTQVLLQNVASHINSFQKILLENTKIRKATNNICECMHNERNQQKTHSIKRKD